MRKTRAIRRPGNRCHAAAREPVITPGGRYVVGASGLVYGSFGYLLARGFSGGDPTALLISLSLATMLTYSGYLGDILRWKVA